MEKQRGFRTGLTQTGLYKHRRWLEASNFGFRKNRNVQCTHVAKAKALITAKLIYAFVFAYADCWFSRHEAAHELYESNFIPGSTQTSM